MPFVVVEVAAAIAVWIAGLHAADAPVLGARGDRFTVNGQPRFLVFISYFDGVRRIPDRLDSTSVLDADLDAFVRRGVDGVRIFPNWQFRAETLMQCDGSLRPLQRDKLARLVARAEAKGLIVDVSFTIDTVRDQANRQCLSAAAYKNGLQAAAETLRAARNALFDLQNEHDKNLPPRDPAHPNGWTAAGWREYLAGDVAPAVKASDPVRLITISWTSDAPPRAVVDYARRANLDVISYHNRGAGWESKTASYAATLKTLATQGGFARPIYFQEPNRAPFDANAAHYKAALANAKQAGAAAWTFHNSVTDTSKPLAGAKPFETLLEPGERAFLARLKSMAEQ